MKNKYTEIQTKNNDGSVLSEERRKFIGKYGKLAAVTPVTVMVLMSSYSSKAIASTGSGDGEDSI
ncbi:hypothetical protein RI844_02550 [Thalassotalea fonticola]|uniref:ESPR domain-containing protein n=1 Tax=Thalassotalea fonticola TaxID=3065649 RepID=A0ABZ0GR00_9GAMM|nr:hypothetical protein RI844_02550 [Colwelliaceae bacterium S1-1]